MFPVAIAAGNAFILKPSERDPSASLFQKITAAVRAHPAGPVSYDVAAVRYLLTEAGLHKTRPDPVDVGALARYDRPLPDLADYDTLLTGACAGSA